MGEVVLSPRAQPKAAAPAAGFAFVDGSLQCDGVAAERIARAVGTPAYVYSASVIREQFRRLDEAFAGTPHRLHYSVKANSNLAVLSLLRELGAGVDIVSGGELHRAALAGFAGRDIVYDPSHLRNVHGLMASNAACFDAVLPEIRDVAARVGLI